MGSMTKFYLISIFVSIMVISQALPTREEVDRLINRLQQDEAREAALYEGLGVRNLDALGGGNLRRDTRAMDSLAGLTFGGMKRFDSLSGLTFGGQKRLYDQVPPEVRLAPHYLAKPTYDEIDHANFDYFTKSKKNFDEIDHANFDSFVKRDVAAANNKGIKNPLHFRY